MGPSVCDIRIRITCKDHLIVSLAIGEEEPRHFSTRLTPSNIAQFRKAFYLELDKFWQLVGIGVESLNFQMVSEAMHHLHTIGSQLNFKIFGVNHYDFEGCFQSFQWRRSGTEGYRPPILQVTSRLEHLLPFEFLPLFDTTEPPEIRTLDDLALVAARFLGFSTITHRVLIRGAGEENEPQLLSDPVLDNLTKLRIRLFQHAGLYGAKEEQTFFGGANWADLRGPWPHKLLDMKQFNDELASQLWEASVPEPGISEVSLDQIQHFSCHCDTDRGDYSEYSIYLAHKKDSWGERLLSRGSERRVTIGDLEQRFSRFPKRRSSAYPLVFFNACGASKVTADGVSSFPDLFLEVGNRGFIGGETKIPDRFAAAFSKQFYWCLIRGVTVGEAIYKARWILLKRIYNPLGILYAAYGDPDLKVRKPLTDYSSSN